MSIKTKPELFTSYADFLAQVQVRIEALLQSRINRLTLAPRLLEAMQYATSGGKRLRPALVYATAQALHVDWYAVDAIAMAVELIHAYSLVHDDLPAMDNDVLRRGQPTCHVQFDEATAILAGDALQSLAFEVLSESNLPAQSVVQSIVILAQASGAQGMVGGQVLDMLAMGQAEGSLAQLMQIHQHKTGALIEASVILSALALGAQSAEAEWRQFGQAIGLGFQIQDDILDWVSSTATLGKTSGTDQVLQKLTYPGLLGLDQAQRLAQQQLHLAQSALQSMSDIDTSLLKLLAVALIERSF